MQSYCSGRWKKGPESKECSLSLEAGKIKETNSSVKPPEGNTTG